jgi:hypothetical protein
MGCVSALLEWDAGHAKARENGETLTDYEIEYRAIPRDADSALSVAGITGPLRTCAGFIPPSTGTSRSGPCRHTSPLCEGPRNQCRGVVIRGKNFTRDTTFPVHCYIAIFSDSAAPGRHGKHVPAVDFPACRP